MLARFFIDRPVLAWVISIVIVLLGAVAAVFLPVAEYPEITPPTVQVTARYPGANAQVMADTVAAPIEQQVVGVEGMLYMSSQSNNDGSYTLDVTFKLGTDVNMAQVLVQNRVAIAEPTLPEVVRTIGVSVKKRSPDILLVVSLYSEDNPETGKPYYDQLYLSNYATIHIKDALARRGGRRRGGGLRRAGLQHAGLARPGQAAVAEPDGWRRDPRLARAKRAGGGRDRSASRRSPKGRTSSTRLSTLGRLVEADQFADIILKTGADGEVTYLKDVGRIELGARSYDSVSQRNGKAGGRHAHLSTARLERPGDGRRRSRPRCGSWKTRFPHGLKWDIVYDTTPFIRESVHEVVVTLRDAVILVAIVVLLFLQDWKSLLLAGDRRGRVAGRHARRHEPAMGFSLNNLTLFGLVLAIGIVVDDAIVVLENIERWLEKGLSVREATIGAMKEITGPILAITLVLSSVLLPSAFLGGITGQFFRQFALTISVAMIISAINAMTMTPARAAWIFGSRKPGEHGHQGKEALPWWSFALFGGLVSVWLLASTLGAWLGLPAGEEHGEAASAACKPPC